MRETSNFGAFFYAFGWLGLFMSFFGLQYSIKLASAM
jgi:hypothetical protein